MVVGSLVAVGNKKNIVVVVVVGKVFALLLKAVAGIAYVVEVTVCTCKVLVIVWLVAGICRDVCGHHKNRDHSITTMHTSSETSIMPSSRLPSANPM